MAIAYEKNKHTYEDYCKLPEQPRVELIDGEFLASPSPRTKHQEISLEISWELTNWVKKTQRGRVFEAPTDVVLSEYNTVQPDILYISNERKHIITEPNIQGAPDFIIEILSPGDEKRDTIIKKALYEKHGVKEYWIVDPDAETISVFILKEEKYFMHQTCAKNDTLESPTLTGFKISHRELFL